jgi:hypothetical protein
MFSRLKKMKSLSNYVAHTPRDETYKQLDEYFKKHLPYELIQHRQYFIQNSRGFGEHAFHAMWYLLFMEYKPLKCLEIGVYRGQVITLWALLGKILQYKPLVSAVSPFSSSGDSVSEYLVNLNYLADTLYNHDVLSLPRPHSLCVDFSNSKNARDFIGGEKWDLIYIDGSHDYEVVSSDFELSYAQLVSGGLIVMDDSSLYFEYSGGEGAFRGHPGPSLVAKEILSSGRMRLIGGVGHNNVFQKYSD